MAKDGACKVVVRLLPPEITEVELLGSIGEFHHKAAQWISFQAGKRYKGEAKPSRNARCYLQFESQERASEFIRDYHGHQFVDSRGENFRAVVCIAPYQKVPRSKSHTDPRSGTIEDDPVYQEFVESLSKPKVFEAPQSIKEQLRPADPKATPLLEHMRKLIKEKKAWAEKKEWDKWNKKWGSIAEEPSSKRAKWYCSECGTSRNLEEDPDERGVFYCIDCWEYHESEAPPKKSKKKKKKDKEKEDYEEAEASTSTKKKKKKGQYEEEGDWWSGKASSWGGGYQEEEKKSKKKKKDKDSYEGYDWYGEEDKKGKKKKKADGYDGYDYGEDKYWRAKKKDDDYYWEEPEKSKRRHKSSKYKESDSWDQGWQETWKESDRGGRSSGHSSGRWRAKQSD